MQGSYEKIFSEIRGGMISFFVGFLGSGHINAHSFIFCGIII